MLENIILIGFMGTGKSTIGHHLSTMLGYPLIDTDTMIVEQEGRPVTEIFKHDGEAHFRSLETAALRSLTGNQCHKRIVSTGGGIILSEENGPLLRDLGFVVWLVAKPETILERTSRNRERPLLQTPNPLETICHLLEQRSPLYQKSAHLVLETTDLTFPEITTGIIESARYHYGHC